MKWISFARFHQTYEMTIVSSTREDSERMSHSPDCELNVTILSHFETGGVKVGREFHCLIGMRESV